MEIVFGVPQVHLDPVFIIIDTDTASYADGDTPYINAGNIDNLATSLEEASTALFQWFDEALKKGTLTSFIYKHVLMKT